MARVELVKPASQCPQLPRPLDPYLARFPVSKATGPLVDMVSSQLALRARSCLARPQGLQFARPSVTQLTSLCFIYFPEGHVGYFKRHHVDIKKQNLFLNLLVTNSHGFFFKMIRIFMKSISYIPRKGLVSSRVNHVFHKVLLTF